MYESGSYSNGWIWSPEQGQHFCYYQDAEGQWQTRWYEPRTSDVDGLTQSFDKVSIGGHDPVNGQPNYQDTTSSSSRPKSKSKSKKSKYSSRKGKEYGGLDPNDGDETETGGQGTSSSTYPDPYHGQQTEYATNEDPYGQELQTAIADSANHNYGIYNSSEPSSHAPYTSADYDDGPAQRSSKDYIAATPGDYEELDPRYIIEPSWKFKPGEIFKVHWAEPAGGNNDRAPSVSGKELHQDGYGGLIHTGFRRYIVIATETGHATCVPIFTYGGKACTKRGIKPEAHGIICDASRSKVRPLPGEPPLGFPTVRANIYLEGEHLAKESRINYSKFIGVEHNVKVLFIGSIRDEDFDMVVDAVNESWDRKDRYRKRRHR